MKTTTGSDVGVILPARAIISALSSFINREDPDLSVAEQDWVEAADLWLQHDGTFPTPSEKCCQSIIDYLHYDLGIPKSKASEAVTEIIDILQTTP